MKSELKFNLPNEKMIIKEDDEKMQEVQSFVDGILFEAETEAQRRMDLKAAEERSKTSISLAAFKNKKIVVRARTYITRYTRGILGSLKGTFPNLPVRRS